MAVKDKTQELKDFGIRVGDERRRLRMGQDEVAQAIGVGRPAMSMIEGGKRYMNQFELARMAKKFRVSIDELMRF
jgi:DNA-binding XRE family transcriptional regulator